MNRVTYSFNRTLDRFIVKPLAVNYQRLTPGIIRSGCITSPVIWTMCR
ncbi:MAG: VacJ family lipoprotein [Pseudohongiella sp.]|nr:VacJ family lipoprotein [Pseudohongiella sp.]